MNNTFWAFGNLTADTSLMPPDQQIIAQLVVFAERVMQHICQICFQTATSVTLLGSSGQLRRSLCAWKTQTYRSSSR